MKRPDYGVRLCFEDPKGVGVHVVYRLSALLPDAEFTALIKIHSENGAVQEQRWDDAKPPASASVLISPIARTIWTTWKKDPSAGGPRRVARWRALKV